MRSRVWLVPAVLMVASLAGCATSTTAPTTPTPTTPGAAQQADESILILVSMDGFRWDYVDWPEASTVRALAGDGVWAEGLIPVFPSKTFPCHYSIVTGLYPGNHGIVSNNMFDPEIGGEFHLSDRAAVEDTRWWGGEPIWVTAEKQGVTSAAMFWPGTESEIAGTRPSYWHRFDKEFPFEGRVDQVLEWLDLPVAERPRLITLYFEKPNDTSHHYGPEAPETRAAVAEVDSRLADLLSGLERRGLRDRVNLVLTSDHGMALIEPDHVVILDDYVEFEEGELFESGAFVQIFPNEGREDLIHAALVDAHPELAIYRKQEIPERFHLSHSPRVAPLIGVPTVGWEALTQRRLDRFGGRLLLGDHGQDPSHPDLHGLFVASGPAFASGQRVDRFESVEIYNLLAAALGIEPAANDGDPANVAAWLAE